MTFLARSCLLWVAVLATGLDLPAQPSPLTEEEPTGGVCTALAVFSEARGEPVDGQAMVAQVVWNRMNDPRYPDAPCEVVNQLNQFEGVQKWDFPRYPWRIDAGAWALALRLAWDVPFGDYEVPGACEDAIEFRSAAMPPPRGLRKLCEIGNHSFYGE